MVDYQYMLHRHLTGALLEAQRIRRLSWSTEPAKPARAPWCNRPKSPDKTASILPSTIPAFSRLPSAIPTASLPASIRGCRSGRSRRQTLEPVYDLLSSSLRKAKWIICRLVFSLRSQFFHSRRHFSSQPKDRSTIQRLGSTTNVCSSLRLTT
jgi:hypothetical protein